MTRFIVLRHGETHWNREARVQGQGDSYLTPEGLAQAGRLAQRLAGERFEVLVASDLGRAMRTAECIAAATGHAIVPDARFRERSFGVGEGLTYAEIDQRFPDVFSRVRETDPDYVIPGGESRRQVYDRVKTGFEDLAERHGDRTVAVVCHGGVLAALYRWIHAIPIATPHPIPIVNASYNAARYEAGAWTVEAWGDTAHLGEMEAFEEL